MSKGAHWLKRTGSQRARRAQAALDEGKPKRFKFLEEPRPEGKRVAGEVGTATAPAMPFVPPQRKTTPKKRERAPGFIMIDATKKEEENVD